MIIQRYGSTRVRLHTTLHRPHAHSIDGMNSDNSGLAVLLYRTPGIER